MSNIKSTFFTHLIALILGACIVLFAGIFRNKPETPPAKTIPFQDSEKTEKLPGKIIQTGDTREIVLVPELRLIDHDKESFNELGYIKPSLYLRGALAYLIDSFETQENKHIPYAVNYNKKFIIDREKIEYLNLKPGDSIADIGCGNGYYLLAFCLQVEPGGKVYAVDTDINAIRFVTWTNEMRKNTGYAKYTVYPVNNRPDDVCLPPASINWAFMRDVHLYNYKEELDFDEKEVLDKFTSSICRALKEKGKVMIIEGVNPNIPEKVSKEIMAERVEKHSEGRLKTVTLKKVPHGYMGVFEKISD